MAPTPRIRRCYHGLGQCAIAAPVAALMRAMGMSRRTASRWAARCSEVGLLPQVDAKGK